jgi:alkanesulfonate monooxygenase SsuD/methylene tetrahydromethanopterin reductase-like flavin-dependent oxidoreductase (luciferase family)
MMQLTANLVDPALDPTAWAGAREAEGWDILSCSDHYFMDVLGTYHWIPHVWVTASQLASATEHVRITTSFANNLFRSPVEFVQAALTMQAVSGGRFDAGLGAGWASAELDFTGQRYPSPRERADRYIEAIAICRQLFDSRSCKFNGDYYEIDLPGMVGFEETPAPPLVGSLGGRRTIAGTAAALDRIELKPSSGATRGGVVDIAKLAAIPRSHLGELVDKVRRVRDDIPVGMYVSAAVGEDELTRSLAAAFPADALHGGFFGPPEKVAAAIFELEAHGISGVQITTLSSDGHELLAPYLFADKRSRLTATGAEA